MLKTRVSCGRITWITKNCSSPSSSCHPLSAAQGWAALACWSSYGYRRGCLLVLPPSSSTVLSLPITQVSWRVHFQMYKLGVVLYKHVLTNNLVSIKLLLNCHFWYCRSLYIINRYSLGISKIANFHTVFETRSYFYVKVVTWGTLVINVSKRSTLEKDLTVIFLCVMASFKTTSHGLQNCSVPLAPQTKIWLLQFIEGHRCLHPSGAQDSVCRGRVNEAARAWGQDALKISSW